MDYKTVQTENELTPFGLDRAVLMALEVLLASSSYMMVSWISLQQKIIQKIRLSLQAERKSCGKRSRGKFSLQETLPPYEEGEIVYYIE
ncbi:uncharacterized protein ACN427_000365 isoform 4-T4 [Glossina fuscipes fuscipes]